MTFYIEKVKGQCDIQNVIQHHSWIGTNAQHAPLPQLLQVDYGGNTESTCVSRRFFNPLCEKRPITRSPIVSCALYSLFPGSVNIRPPLFNPYTPVAQTSAHNRE